MENREIFLKNSKTVALKTPESIFIADYITQYVDRIKLSSLASN